MSRPRVLVIGLDGATFDVLTPLVEQGRMPNLGKFMSGGSWGNLRSTMPPLTAPAWSSFATGMNPGKHGVFQFFQSHGGGPKVDLDSVVNSTSIRAPTLWDRLSNAGLKVGLINIPMTYPPQPVNGFVVSGMPAPLKPDQFTYPPELAERLAGYRLDLSYFMGGREFQAQYVPASQSLLRDMSQLLRERQDAALKLMREDEWDFFMVVFTETDRLGHHLWARTPEEVTQIEGPLAMWYQELDGAIDRLVAEAGADCDVLIMSDHGMGPSASRRVYVNDWLIERGYLKLLPATGSRAVLKRAGITRDRAARLLRLLPASVSHRLIRAASHDGVPVDWQKTRAYYTPIYEFIGGIELVRSEAADDFEVEMLRDRLRQQLSTLVDPLTQEAAIRRIWDRDELYSGPFIGDAPDLIIEFHPKFVGNHRTGNHGVFADRVEVAAVRGAHRFEGIFLGAGTSIAKTERRDDYAIEDIAPTILYLLGQPIPEELDGRVLTNIIDPSVLRARQPQYVAEGGEFVRPAVELDAAEEEQIRRQLAGLGYLA
jgi:predicted AlkP superfamily phosphohydrolase/phosphomutase